MLAAIVCDVLGEENNGTTVAAMNLIRHLKARGHEVRVVCPDEYRRGQPGFYVMPQLNVGPLNAYVRRNGVSIAVTDDAVLTFDRGIAKSLDSAEIPCVRLNEGGITLPGYGCGFLGGACGYHDGTVYLCGNADTLPCAEDIRRNGCSIVSLSENPVTDCGGIKIFKKM